MPDPEIKEEWGPHLKKAEYAFTVLYVSYGCGIED